MNPEEIDPKRITYSDLISQEKQHQLLLLRDLDTKTRFTIGGIANEIYDNPPLVPYIVTRELVQRAVGFWCGRTARSVKYYADVERQISPDLREEFDNLAFAHFAFAARPEYRNRIREVLEFASVHNCSPEGLEVAFMKFEATGASPEDRPDIGYYNGGNVSGDIRAIYYADPTELYEGFAKAFLTNLPKDNPDFRTRARTVLSELYKLLRDMGYFKNRQPASKPEQKVKA